MFHRFFHPRSVITLALVTCGLAFPALAADHEIRINPPINYRVFIPSELTIEVGDTVTWTSFGLVGHNIVADDGSFRCGDGCDDMGGSGDLVGGPVSISRTFDSPGVIDYHCELHENDGERGRLIVVPADGNAAGELRFVASNPQANEGDGMATISVSRVDGTGGPVSVSYTATGGSATEGEDFVAASGTLEWAGGDGAPKTFSIELIDDGEQESAETVNLTLSNPTGGASLGTPSSVTLILDDNDDPTTAGGSLSFSSTLFEGAEDGSEAVISVTRSGGSLGAASVEYSTADGSATAGADYASTAGTLGWNDGESGTKTFSVPLFDDGDVEGPETINLMLSNPMGDVTLLDSSATLTVSDDEQGDGCIPNATTLCLNKDDRFSVQVAWADGSGPLASAKAFDIGARDSGLFYFFTPDNLELLIKVVDACGLEGFESFWVFYAATTTLELEITVTDTTTGEVKTYTNPLGNPAAPVTDTAAFTTCP